MINLAKQKKTAFARAVLASADSGAVTKSNAAYRSMSACQELGAGDTEATVDSKRPSTSAAGGAGRSNAVTSIANLVIGRP